MKARTLACFFVKGGRKRGGSAACACLITTEQVSSGVGVCQSCRIRRFSSTIVPPRQDRAGQSRGFWILPGAQLLLQLTHAPLAGPFRVEMPFQLLVEILQLAA